MVRTLPGHFKDTVAQGLQQMGQTDLAPDVYGKGELIESFQDLMARDSGKEAAVFFPSGTMAQQIMLRIWCDRKGVRRVAYHPTAHVEIHEQDGLKVLHAMEVGLIGSPERLFTLADLQALDLENLAAVLFELPQREIGGQLPSWDELVEMTDFLRNKGIYLHLDGARLLETLPFYQKRLPDVCALFDSVYMSFYKTLGGISGAVLLSDRLSMEEAKIWKRRYGGDLFHLYPYILSAQTVYSENKDKMESYWKKAMELAARFAEIPWIKVVPSVPRTNMFHLHFDAELKSLEEHLEKIRQELGINLFRSLVAQNGYVKTEFTVAEQTMAIEQETVDRAIQELKNFKK